MSNTDFTIFSSTQLREFTTEVFVHFDVPYDDAILAADVLAYSDEHGIDSHGIARLKTYFDLLRTGKINPKPEIKIIREKSSTATIDGDNGLGLVVGPKCMDIAIQKAKLHGSGWVSVCNTNHYGAAGYYPVMALKDDIIGLSMTNTTKGVAPFNGAEKMLGTNPLAIAFPAYKEPPIIIDLASSAVAYGKVEIADRKNEKIPEGWCIDKNGYSTTMPSEMINGGALLPLGSDKDGSGHKGYCLASMVDILSAVLSGANWGPFTVPFAINSALPEKQVGKGIGHFFGAWEIDGFRDKNEFKTNIDEWIHTMRNTLPRPGTSGVLIPGDPEREAYQLRMRDGIPLHKEVVNSLMDIASYTGINIPS
ncbi:malate dehydrogenase (NAD) [Pseudopedobacter saltans DSM 12145]|uniref:Malate dehydrogenase (NAD) n=1 Tax=Pseudopedobacter saltans (strain ATCC 51119 / DSM 12145 / JCM 21818 / CCUG 39354 / LMG 10337 / NBRC 100064 / NCIMB 13643) TaxID=762903 RepID=F0SBQ9_PSESL|nr:Ldh family oxidoreductase [Pseudopedobacter saltans]ADY52750.1 malate dehydrogenase (NAD) [Pseudopedobacter saltans DSM 12145]